MLQPISWTYKQQHIITYHKCMPNTNQVSDHQASKQPQKSIGQWTMCSNIPKSSSSLILLWNQRLWVWSPAESPICGPSPDPPTGATHDLKKNNGVEKKRFSSFGKSIPNEERFCLESSLTFYFYFWNGKN